MFKKKRKGKINDKVLLVSSRPPTDLQLCEAGWGTSLSHASHFRLQHPQTAPKRLNVQVCSGKTGISSSWRKEESRTDGVPRSEDQLSCALNCGAPPPTAPRKRWTGGGQGKGGWAALGMAAETLPPNGKPRQVPRAVPGLGAPIPPHIPNPLPCHSPHAC